MGFSLRKKKRYALSCSTRGTRLSEILKGPSGRTDLRPLSFVETSIADPDTLPALLGMSSLVHGELSVAMQMSYFEITSLSIPKMPRNTIPMALPYHLSKALDKPLSDYVYDWQITNSQKDRLQINVYLFPAALFINIRDSFSRKNVTLKHLEADIFAAFAHLFDLGRLPKDEPSLCMLLWQESISVAILENGTLPLARSILAAKPNVPYATKDEPVVYKSESPSSGGEITFSDKGEQIVSSGPLDGATEKIPDTSESLLDGFNLFGHSHEDYKPTGNTDIAFALAIETEPETTLPNPEPTELFIEQPLNPDAAAWADYIEKVGLEIMRTRDYYSSVHKGGTVKKIYIGGAYGFWNDLEGHAKNALGFDIMPLVKPTPGLDMATVLLDAICAGTGTRW